MSLTTCYSGSIQTDFVLQKEGTTSTNTIEFIDVQEKNAQTLIFNENESLIEATSTLEVLDLSTRNIDQFEISDPDPPSLITPFKEDEKSENDLNSIWKKELHFPSIKGKKKAKSQKPMILAITSEEWKNQQNEKIKKQEEQQRLKELRKFEREIKKKVKQEEDEHRKQEKLKIKKQKEVLKQETEAKMQLLLKEKAKILNISSYELPKKRRVLNNITNDAQSSN